jgi:hypothetical protein
MYVNVKNDKVKLLQDWRGVKESSAGGEFQYDIFDTL